MQMNEIIWANNKKEIFLVHMSGGFALDSCMHAGHLKWIFLCDYVTKQKKNNTLHESGENKRVIFHFLDEARLKCNHVSSMEYQKISRVVPSGYEFIEIDLRRCNGRSGEEK